MATPLTDEQLAEIEVGLEGVTPGPWRWESDFYGSLRQSRPDGYYGDEVMGAETRFESMSPYISVCASDARHIARLNPQTVAEWLARDKAMRARIAELESEIERLKSPSSLNPFATIGEDEAFKKLTVEAGGDMLRFSHQLSARMHLMDVRCKATNRRNTELEAENKRLIHSHALAVECVDALLKNVLDGREWRDEEEK